MNNKTQAKNTVVNHLKFAIFVFFITLNSSVVLAEGLGIGVFLSDTGFLKSDRIDFRISGYNNSTTAEKVDVHIALLTKEGVFYEYPDWNTAFKPWISSFSLPANFTLAATLVGNLDNFPSGLEPGVYILFVALTQPGTLDILALNSSSFAILKPNNSFLAAAVSLTHLNTVNGPAPFDKLIATGAFLRADFNTSDILEWQTQFNPDIDHCIFYHGPTTLDVFVGEENVSYLDAGTALELTSPTENISLARQFFKDKTVYTDANVNKDFYQAGVSYTALGFGSANIPAFSGTVVAPQEIIVTQPDLDRLEKIDSNKDLLVRWQGLQGIGAVEVQLQGGATNSIRCRFIDDGEGIIPSALIVQLRDAISDPIPLGFPNGSLAVSRMHIELIDLEGEPVTLSVISTKAAVTQIE